MNVNLNIPFINFHFLDNEKTIVEIEMISVPPGVHGSGRRFYNEWEKSLPPTVKLVTLFAADTGSGNSDGFWEKMGFDFFFDYGEDSAIDYESQHRMHKGVNGYQTPPSILWTNSDVTGHIRSYLNGECNNPEYPASINFSDRGAVINAIDFVINKFRYQDDLNKNDIEEIAAAVMASHKNINVSTCEAQIASASSPKM